MNRSGPSPRPSHTVTLTARGLSVDRAGATVLANIDLTVAGNQRLGVVGPNGVGKSTLLAALSGAIPADAARSR